MGRQPINQSESHFAPFAPPDIKPEGVGQTRQLSHVETTGFGKRCWAWDSPGIAVQEVLPALFRFRYLPWTFLGQGAAANHAGDPP